MSNLDGSDRQNNFSGGSGRVGSEKNGPVDNTAVHRRTRDAFAIAGFLVKTYFRQCRLTVELLLIPKYAVALVYFTVYYSLRTTGPSRQHQHDWLLHRPVWFDRQISFCPQTSFDL